MAMSRLNKFEIARVLGDRATAIAHGADLMIDPGEETDPRRIARMELAAHVLPWNVVRVLPDGDEVAIPIRSSDVAPRYPNGSETDFIHTETRHLAERSPTRRSVGC